MNSATIAAATAALLAFGVAQAKPPAADDASVTTQWALSLDADGKVVDLAQTSKLKPVLAELVAKAIRGWTFEPGRVDCAPQPTVTTLSVSLSLEPVRDGYAIRVTDARTGSRVDKVPRLDLKSRDLPRTAQAYAMRVAYDAGGKVVSAVPADGVPKLSSSMRGTFERLFRGMTFVPERVAGQGVAAEVVVPACISIGRDAQQARCEWKAPDRDPALRDGEALALDPAARLLSDVVGRTL